jgi:hypothetical protein
MEEDNEEAQSTEETERELTPQTQKDETITQSLPYSSRTEDYTANGYPLPPNIPQPHPNANANLHSHPHPQEEEN